MNKKVLFVSEALWIGGIETALVDLLRRMEHEKYDITLLLRRAVFHGDLRQRLPAACRVMAFDREDGQYRFARLYHLTEEAPNPSRLHKAMMWAVPAIRWVENRLYTRYIRRQMRQEHFDTCVIYSDAAAETAVRAIRADRFLLFYHHGAMRKVSHDEVAYKKADKIIAVSGPVERKLRAFRPKYAHKMTTIHNLTDVEGIRAKGALPLEEEFPADRFNIVSCGRVAREKGMDLAVEACAELVRRGHQNIRWWIVGGGPAEAEVRAKIAELGMDDHVKLLGMLDNPYPWMKAADLYVQPSRVEAYGLTIAEAMALGKQIVSTDTDGAAELIRRPEDGLLCAVNADSMAAAIEKAMINPTPEKDFSAKLAGNNQAVLERLKELL